MHRTIKGIQEEALLLLKKSPLPGNIRQLQNMIERAFIFCETDYLCEADLELASPLPTSDPVELPSGSRSLKELERQAIIASLNRWDGNRTRAAMELGLTRRTLINKIKEYGL